MDDERIIGVDQTETGKTGRYRFWLSGDEDCFGWRWKTDRSKAVWQKSGDRDYRRFYAYGKWDSGGRVFLEGDSVSLPDAWSAGWGPDQTAFGICQQLRLSYPCRKWDPAERDPETAWESRGKTGGRSDQQTYAQVDETGEVYDGEYRTFRTCGKILYSFHIAHPKVSRSSDPSYHQRKLKRKIWWEPGGALFWTFAAGCGTVQWKGEKSRRSRAGSCEAEKGWVYERSYRGRVWRSDFGSDKVGRLCRIGKYGGRTCTCGGYVGWSLWVLWTKLWTGRRTYRQDL